MAAPRARARDAAPPFQISRRGFLAGVSAAAAGLALGLDLPRAAADPGAQLFQPNVWLQIGTDGAVTVAVHRSEMGQGIRSTMPVIIADELGADLARVHVVQADGDAKYGDQDTDGSSSIRGKLDWLRAMGAAAREMLVAAAAKRWGVSPAHLIARDHAVHDGHRALGFGELALAAAALPVPKQPVLRPFAELRHVGTQLPNVDGDDIITGRAIYGADVVLPHMLTAAIARPPVAGGKVARYDAARALAIPGVRKVVELPALALPFKFKPLGGVAVLADHTWAALKGRAALAIEWDAGPYGDYDSDAYRAELDAAIHAPGVVVRHTGDVDAALAGAAKLVEASYHAPHLAHQMMEPPAAVAHVTADRAEVWSPTQSPQEVRSEVAAALGLALDKVTAHVTLLGGAFGRKAKPDCEVEAALLARAAGVPVRVQWTRDDEMRHAYYHTTSAQLLTAGLDRAGEVVAWRHRTAFPAIGSTFDGTSVHPSAGELGQGVTDLPLAIPNVQCESGAAPARVRIGWMRSVCNIHHAFAVQSFIAELAHATGRDHRELLLRVLGPARHVDAAELGVKDVQNYRAPLAEHPIDTGRLRGVIERVTDRAGWGTPQGANRALGLAAHRSFLSYVAVVVAVTRDARGLPHVERAWVAADVGRVMNPDRVRAQMEGSIVFGTSIALHGAITMKRGVVEQQNFRDSPIARIGEAPQAIDVELVASTLPPGGVGEPGTPPVAPAIANAWFALTGERVRDLPMIKTRT